MEKKCFCDYFNEPKGHAGDKPNRADWHCEVHGTQHRCYAGTIGEDARVVECRHTEKKGWEEDYEKEKVFFLQYDKASGSRWLDDEALKAFITRIREEAREEGFIDGQKHAFGVDKERVRQEAKEEERKEIESRVGFLRQWLNENRIGNDGQMVTTEELLVWLRSRTT